MTLSTRPARVDPSGGAGGHIPSKRAGNRLITYLVLIVGVVITIAPLLWMVSTALKTHSEAIQVPIQWLPSVPQFINFVEVFRAIPLARMLLNTALVSLSVTALSLCTSVMAAYAFARLEFRGRDLLFYVYLGTLMVPEQVTMVPIFILMRALDWLDSYPALIFPSAFTAFGVFLLRQFFLAIPREMEDAARVDGLNRFAVLWRIVLPLAKPALVTLGVFLLISEWSRFLWPLIVVQSPEMQTVQVGLRTFLGEFGTDWTLLMAGATVAELPILFLYVFLQRYIIEGIATSGVKG